MRTNPQSAWHRGQQGFFTLIGLLVVLVIIGMLFRVYMGGGSSSTSPNTPGQSGSTLGTTVRMARGTVCRNNLSQLRADIARCLGESEQYPASLQDLDSQVPLSCPDGDVPYQYDPQTGQVRCVHAGHVRF